jgi:hypothetical protein
MGGYLLSVSLFCCGLKMDLTPSGCRPCRSDHESAGTRGICDCCRSGEMQPLMRYLAGGHGLSPAAENGGPAGRGDSPRSPSASRGSRPDNPAKSGSTPHWAEKRRDTVLNICEHGSPASWAHGDAFKGKISCRLYFLVARRSQTFVGISYICNALCRLDFE